MKKQPKFSKGQKVKCTGQISFVCDWIKLRCSDKLIEEFMSHDCLTIKDVWVHHVSPTVNAEQSIYYEFEELPGWRVPEYYFSAESEEKLIPLPRFDLPAWEATIWVEYTTRCHTWDSEDAIAGNAPGVGVIQVYDYKTHAITDASQLTDSDMHQIEGKLVATLEGVWYNGQVVMFDTRLIDGCGLIISPAHMRLTVSVDAWHANHGVFDHLRDFTFEFPRQRQLAGVEGQFVPDDAGACLMDKRVKINEACTYLNLEAFYHNLRVRKIYEAFPNTDFLCMEWEVSEYPDIMSAEQCQVQVDETIGSSGEQNGGPLQPVTAF